MTGHEEDSRELVASISAHWAPPTTNPSSFQHALQARLRRSRLRRASGFIVLATAAVVAILTLLLPTTQDSARIEAPQVVASAEVTDSIWWQGALDSRSSSQDLPGEYQALASLFLSSTPATVGLP